MNLLLTTLSDETVMMGETEVESLKMYTNVVDI